MAERARGAAVRARPAPTDAEEGWAWHGDGVVAGVGRALAAGDHAEARARIRAAVRGRDGDGRCRPAPAGAGTDDAPLRRPIFICGLHRSGTSLLADRLAAGWRVARLQGTGVPEDEGQFLQDVYAQEAPAGGPGLFAFSPLMREAPVTDPGEAARLARRLSASWRARADGRGPLLEKSPPNIVRIGWLRSLFPDARFIIWTRDPRAVAMATRKWRPGLDPRFLMLHWNAAHLAALMDLGPDCLLASYEALCADPEAELARIAAFCGIAPRRRAQAPRASFAALRNSNGAYLQAFPPAAANLRGLAIWPAFGYHFGTD